MIRGRILEGKKPGLSLRRIAEKAGVSVGTPNRLANSDIVRSPFSASSATFDLKTGLCCLRFDMSDLPFLKARKHQNSSLRHCPIYGE
jgi:hypothetical protein